MRDSYEQKALCTTQISVYDTIHVTAYDVYRYSDFQDGC